MTPEEIDALTIADVRAIAARATEAAEQLKKVQSVLAALSAPPQRVVPGPPPVVAYSLPAQPFPCMLCHRQGPMQPGETVRVEECVACGNPLPSGGVQPRNGRMTNKGPIVMSPEELQRRAEMLASPAFDANGDPIA